MTHRPLRPCGVCSQPVPDGDCPRHPKRGGYRPRRPSVVNGTYSSRVWAMLRRAALLASGGRCDYCGGPANTGDHVVPHSKGGVSSPENTLAACARCNTSKGNRTLQEWVHSGLAPEPAVRLLAQRIIDRLPV